MDAERHRAHTGAANGLILENLAYLAGHHARLAIRIPLVPGVNDDETNLRATGEFVAALPGVHPVSILPYHHTGQAKYERLGRPYRPGTPGPPAGEAVLRSRAILEGYGLTVQVGG